MRESRVRDSGTARPRKVTLQVRSSQRRAVVFRSKRGNVGKGKKRTKKKKESLSWAGLTYSSLRVSIALPSRSRVRWRFALALHSSFVSNVVGARSLSRA